MTARPAALAGIALSLGLVGCRTVTDATAPAPPASGSWTLTWSDEFEGPAGTRVDAAKWKFDLGGRGWGNKELESYTDRLQNAHLDGTGILVIEAIREPYVGRDGIARDYTSARLKTEGLFAPTYGRFEARLKLPQGQGVWPAFWLLGADAKGTGWPACGEIDIMENIGKEPGIVHGTIHGPGYSGASAIGSSFALPAGQRLADDFHVFAVEWEPNVLRFSMDGQVYSTRTPSDLPAGRRWVFDHPFFVLINLAVGGNWPGSPDATTVFPQRLLVDYVRVYQR